MKPSAWTQLKRDLTGYAFLAPNFIGFLAFTSIPVLVSVLLAFCDYDIISPPKWAGLKNFENLLGFHREKGSIAANDPAFWKYLWNTGYLLLGIPLSMACSLGLAMILNQKLRGRVLFRTLFFLPSVTAGVAVYMLWSQLYQPDFGLINSLLGTVGIEGPRWLEDPHWAKPSLILMSVWAGMGGVNMILYLAGLQNIDPELYEAAEMDGASNWQKFRYITVPLLTPTTFFILITSTIAGLQGGFETAYIMTEGGPFTPHGETTTIGYYIYTSAYQFLKMGYAAATAWVLFMIVFVLTMINWRYGGKRVEYG